MDTTTTFKCRFRLGLTEICISSYLTLKQPLMDNLESATYEVFEMDPVKYDAYERAVYEALVDKHLDVTVVAVVGAGRGPIVSRVLKAAEKAKRPVKLFAVEKNPNAILTLRMRKETEWGDAVDVVHADLRNWQPTDKVRPFAH
jgi:protein arginine N-methyltransferase 5